MAALSVCVKMASISLIRNIFAKKLTNVCAVNVPISCQVQQKRTQWNLKKNPQPGIKGKSYRRIIHYKEEYTVEPLEVTNLGGRDPVTGRVIAKGIGGGLKHKCHWINWIRDGPSDLNEPPKEERVLAVFKDGLRTSNVALVGHGQNLKYILATENMKEGDIIRTHKGVPHNYVRAFEGDAYPLGALPMGTVVHCVEKYPGLGGFLIHAAGTAGTILRRHENDRVIVKMPSKKEFSLHETCMATVGRLSNILHASTPLKNVQQSRELGNRPRSGLWQKKTGRLGRKIKPLPPAQNFDSHINVMAKESLMLNLPHLNN